jgi:hypothetical protein
MSKESNIITIKISKHNPDNGEILSEDMFVAKDYQYEMIIEMLKKFMYLYANDLD